MKTATFIGFIICFVMTGRVIGGDDWWDVQIVPRKPTSCDVIVITLSGWWPDSCIPNASAISMIGTDIYFDVIWDYPPHIGCLTVFTRWERTRSIGPLSGGTYTIYARFVGSPYGPDPSTVIARFTVTAQSHVATVYYVDAARGDDRNSGLSPETPFATIQKGVDTAKTADTVIIAPGIYSGQGNRNINLRAKAISLCSVDPNDLNVVTNTIIDCQSIEGSPAFCFHNNEGPGSVLAGLTITNGRAEKGGAISCCDYSSPTLSNCVIGTNLARFGAGVYCNDFSGPTILNCVIASNTASAYGGGIYAAHNSNPTIVSCTIKDNMGGDGGGIYCIDNSSVAISNCTISSNSAKFRGGGIYVRADTNSTITNCTISGNAAKRYCGGGIFCNDSHLLVSNCTFLANSAPERSALALDSWRPKAPSNLKISNCILWDGGHEILNNDGSTISVTYTDVQGGWPGEGNIDTDPCLAQVGYWDPNGTLDDPNDDFWVEGDYHLKSQAGRWDPASESWVKDDVMSPCVDAGNPMSPIGSEPFPNGGRVNMGAYGGTAEASKSYFGKPVCETIVAGDINGDCKVDFQDFRILAFHWLQEKNR